MAFFLICLGFSYLFGISWLMEWVTYTDCNNLIQPFKIPQFYHRLSPEGQIVWGMFIILICPALFWAWAIFWIVIGTTSLTIYLGKGVLNLINTILPKKKPQPSLQDKLDEWENSINKTIIEVNQFLQEIK